MSNSRKSGSELPGPRVHDLSTSPAEGTSRRAFLKSGAGVAAGGAAAHVLPERALAQPAGTAERNPDVRRLQRQRRILLKGGIVLTLDRQIGDFARADLLIEDGKISAVRPDIRSEEHTV